MVDYGSLFDHVKSSAEDSAREYRDAIAKLKKESSDRHAAMIKPLIEKVKPALDDAAYQLSHKGVTLRQDFIPALLDQPDKPTNMIHFQLMMDEIKGRVFIFQVEKSNASGMYIETENGKLIEAKALFATHINSVNQSTVENVIRRAVEEFATKLVEEKDKPKKR